jgi:hypothetical protein
MFAAAIDALDSAATGEGASALDEWYRSANRGRAALSAGMWSTAAASWRAAASAAVAAGFDYGEEFALYRASEASWFEASGFDLGDPTRQSTEVD